MVALSWASRRRLLALIEDAQGRGRHRIVVLDPVAARTVQEKGLPREAPIADLAVLPTRGLALLLVPLSSFGPPQLVVLEAKGPVRVTALTEIVSGWEVSDSGLLPRQRVPALAIDPRGRRAVVVPPAGAIAEVDLAHLQVSYHALKRKVSLLGRLRNWLEPIAEAKGARGSVREARWLENGRIAVSGFDGDGFETTGAGLDLIDPNDWSVATVDARASFEQVSEETTA